MQAVWLRLTALDTPESAGLAAAPDTEVHAAKAAGLGCLAAIFSAPGCGSANTQPLPWSVPQMTGFLLEAAETGACSTHAPAPCVSRAPGTAALAEQSLSLLADSHKRKASMQKSKRMPLTINACKTSQEVWPSKSSFRLLLKLAEPKLQHLHLVNFSAPQGVHTIYLLHTDTHTHSHTHTFLLCLTTPCIDSQPTSLSPPHVALSSGASRCRRGQHRRGSTGSTARMGTSKPSSPVTTLAADLQPGRVSTAPGPSAQCALLGSHTPPTGSFVSSWCMWSDPDLACSSRRLLQACS